MSFLLITICWQNSIFAQKTQSLSLAFYNLENLFDTIDEPGKDDQDFLPDGMYRWNTERYRNKLANMSKVIKSLNGNQCPDILGVCEIENRRVLSDLINQPALSGMQYAIVHRESPDERGIDVALIYRKKKLKVIHQHWITPELNGDKTRECLAVRLQDKKKQNFWVMVVHAPSRREGKEISDPKRMVVSNAVISYYSEIRKKYPGESVYLVGDFNDGPSDLSMQKYVEAGFKNAMIPLQNDKIGTLKYNNDWFIFDQILYFNGNKLTANPESASIFNPDWLKQHGDPKYEGSPFKTFGGRKYLNGYSDHFPVQMKIQ